MKKLPTSRTKPLASGSTSCSKGRVESVELLIAAYQSAYDESQIDGDDQDDWSCRAADAAEALKGKTVTADVTWPNGRVTATTGVVDSIINGKVYLESMLGLVEGDAMTMSEA